MLCLELLRGPKINIKIKKKKEKKKKNTSGLRLVASQGRAAAAMVTAVAIDAAVPVVVVGTVIVVIRHCGRRGGYSNYQLKQKKIGNKIKKGTPLGCLPSMAVVMAVIVAIIVVVEVAEKKKKKKTIPVARDVLCLEPGTLLRYCCCGCR